MPKTLTVTNWKVRKVAGNLFRLKYENGSSYFTLTGGTDTLNANIQCPDFRGFKLHGVVVVFDDATAKTFKLSIVPRLALDDSIDLVDDPNNVIQNYLIGCKGVTFLGHDCDIRFTVVGTSGKKFKPLIYLEVLEEGEGPEEALPGIIEENQKPTLFPVGYEVNVLRDGRRWEELGVNTLVVEETLNDTDKVLSVPAGKTYKIMWIHVEFSATATTGNRALVVNLRDSSDDLIFENSAYNTHAANLKETYMFAPGVNRDPPRNAAGIFGLGGVQQIPIPLETYLNGGEDVRIVDSAAIADGFDDMIIQMKVKEYPIEDYVES